MVVFSVTVISPPGAKNPLEFKPGTKPANRVRRLRFVFVGAVRLIGGLIRAEGGVFLSAVVLLFVFLQPLW